MPSKHGNAAIRKRRVGTRGSLHRAQVAMAVANITPIPTLEEREIRWALYVTGNNISLAAIGLKMDRRSLQRIMRRLNLRGGRR